MLRWMVVATLGAFLLWSSSLGYYVLHEILPPARCEFARLAEPALVVLACDLMPTFDVVALVVAVIGVALLMGGPLGSWWTRRK